MTTEDSLERLYRGELVVVEDCPAAPPDERENRSAAKFIVAAREYLRRGWCPITVAPHGKVPEPRKRWQQQRLTGVDLWKWFSSGKNIGIHFGMPSDGVVDLDLDCREALALADYLLPATDSIFGRKSRRRSHRLYRVSHRTDYLKLTDPLLDSEDPRRCLVELRQDGHQTIVPPSEADGQVRTWDVNGEPAPIQAEVLAKCVHWLGAASLLVRYWPTRDRHEARMALSGCFGRGGWTEKETIVFIEAVIRVAQPGDGEAYSKVSGDTHAAFAKLARKQPVTGFTRLAELIDKKIVRQVCDWLQIGDTGDGRGHESERHGSRGSSASTTLVKLANEMDLFHDADGEPYASIVTDDRIETLRLTDRRFRDQLSHRYYAECGKVPSANAVKDALSVIAGRARFEGQAREVNVRLAEHDRAIFLDLANEQREVIEITGTGWRVVKQPPVRFRRPRGMLSLPNPERGGDVIELRQLVNVASDDDFMLLVGWLTATLRPGRPFPVLVLQGEH